MHRLVMYLPHHKTARWTEAAICVPIPAYVARLLYVYMQYVRPVLAQPATQQVFVTPTGVPLEPSRTTELFIELQQRYHAPWPCPIAPQRLRHVHAEHMVRSLMQLAAQLDTYGQGGWQAAVLGHTHIMGTSHRMLQRIYSRDFFSQSAAVAVQQITTWRRSMLAAMQRQQQQQPA